MKNLTKREFLKKLGLAGIVGKQLFADRSACDTHP